MMCVVCSSLTQGLCLVSQLGFLIEMENQLVHKVIVQLGSGSQPGGLSWLLHNAATLWSKSEK